MPSLDTMEESKVKHVLVFGPPKSGKTELVGRLAEDGFKLVWLDLENGRDTLFKLAKEHQKSINMLAIPDTRGYPIAIETCLKAVTTGVHYVCTEHGKVKCAKCMDIKASKAKEGKEVTPIDLYNMPEDHIVVFDSLTQLTNSAIANITRNKPDDYKMNYDDWAALGKVLDTFLSYIQNAPFHVVCISHESAVEMQDGKEKLVPTAGTRNFSRNSAKYFGEVIYCEVVNKHHVFASSTLYKNNVLTGSRTGAVLEAVKKGDTPKLASVFK